MKVVPSANTRQVARMRKLLGKLFSELPWISYITHAFVEQPATKIMKRVYNTLLVLKRDVFRGRMDLKWFRLDRELNSRVNRIVLPRVERFSLGLVNKAYKLSEKVLPKSLGISKKDVVNTDFLTIMKHCAYKPLRLSNDLDSFVKSLSWLSSLAECISNDRTYEQVLEQIPHKTSSCYPLYTKKNDITAIEQAIKQFERVKEMIGKGEISVAWQVFAENPTTVFHRYTPKIKSLGNLDEPVELDIKKRQVFGVPFWIILLEEIVYGETIRNFEKLPFFSYSNLRVDTSAQVTKIRNNARANKNIILSADVTAMDANLSHVLIFVILTMLCPEKYEKFGLLHRLYYVLTPIAYSKGFTISFGGNMSGSKATSILNSCSILLALNSFFIKRYKRNITDEEVAVLGDDFILSISEDDIDDLVEHLNDCYHIYLNPLKMGYNFPEEEIHYLGFDWNQDGEPYATEEWIIGRICYPERYVKIPGRIRTYQRFCSICFQSADGRLFYDKILGKYDPYFRKQFFGKEDIRNPLITYYDKEGTMFEFSIPLSDLLDKGWRCF